MEKFIPSVKDTSLFEKIAKNLVNPSEVTREPISNAIDAELNCYVKNMQVLSLFSCMRV